MQRRDSRQHELVKALSGRPLDLWCTGAVDDADGRTRMRPSPAALAGGLSFGCATTAHSSIFHKVEGIQEVTSPSSPDGVEGASGGAFDRS